MRKLLLFIGLSAFMTVGLVACSNDNENEKDPDITIGDDENKEDDNKEDDDKGESEEPDKEDFTLQTKDNGLSAEKGSYLFSTLKEGDIYPPEASIILNTDDSWNHCSSLNERYTRIVAEDKNVIPDGAVKLEIVTNMDLVGSSGSNEIEQIKLNLDRSLIKPGKTMLKLEVQPNNGSSSIAKLTTICVEVEVKEFGTIEVDTYNINLNVDLSGLEEILKEVENPQSITLSLTDTVDEASVYGYSADYTKSVEISLGNTYLTASINNFKFAVGHVYRGQIFVEAKKVSGRRWISLVTDNKDEDLYTVVPNENGDSSNISVFQDNITLETSVGEYYSLN